MEKKTYEKPVLQELGTINQVVQQNGIYGPIDGSIIVMSNLGYSPHRS